MGIWRGKSSPSKPTKFNSQQFQIKNTNSRQYKLYDSDLESIRFFSTCKLVFDIFPVESLARMYNDCVRSKETIAQTKCNMVAGTAEGFFMVLLVKEGRNTAHIYVAVIYIANPQAGSESGLRSIVIKIMGNASRFY
jgi:hypothetical protein